MDQKGECSKNVEVESDNCSSQYQSTNHFENMQHSANKFDVVVMCVFGVAEHGKGEVDHVGGLAKTTISRTIASGEIFSTTSVMVEFLKKHFENKDHLVYKVCEILKSDLDDARFEERFLTIAGSSLFHLGVHVSVILLHFRPVSACVTSVNFKMVHAQFQDYELCVQIKKAWTLRSDHLEFEGQEELETNEESGVVREGTMP